ncbi:DUF6259 domain-containing protein [Deinococcus pimensis]|uniref:DUF6259 domain-containing protein n=1 Tax=Deinococcus pimensis TaxID=309888 RepID=UPI0004829366|nr:DUF6259 domain-containing protein [Deinococcus pimensis]
MILHDDHLTVAFDEAGNLTHLGPSDGNFLSPDAPPEPLFTLRFRDPAGAPRDVPSTQLTCSAWQEDARRGALEFTSPDGALRVHVDVRVDHPARSRWRLRVDREADGVTLEWIDFPGVVIPDDFAANGGPGRLLWPALEGTLVEDAGQRDQTWMRYESVEYPSRGWEGFFPGACGAQFMAYLRGERVLYLGAHDPHEQPKVLEYYRVPGGVRLELRLYPGAPDGPCAMDFDVALDVLHGDWYAAAETYRTWWEANALRRPRRLVDRIDLPSWLGDSPVTVMYPVRGEGDTGGMEPNRLFPYVRGLDALQQIAEDTDSRVLALLMHWEGTAPWAPPYVWPPYGGEDLFKTFVDAMHDRGHLVGVYASGVGWTQTSLLTEYSREAQFEREGLRNVMCLAPDGSLPFGRICNGWQRWGYDMCTAAPFTREVFQSEARNVASSGVDYFQALDQNIGGTSYFCYSRDHGHPPAPGAWQVRDTRRMLDDTVSALHADGHAMVLGTEGAAAPTYADPLPFNDARWNFAFMPGRPVPLYAFLYHEYTNNFMGNQVGAYDVLDVEACPENLAQRVAYAFTIGDLPAVVLRVGGGVDWSWNARSTSDPPDQGAVKTLIRHLNAWRRGAGRAFLHLGRMLPPFPVEGVVNVPLRRRDGSVLDVPSLLTSRWRAPNGREAQFVVNYRAEAQRCRVVTDDGALRGVRTDPWERHAIPEAPSELTVPAYSCVMVELADVTHDEPVKAGRTS